MIPCLRARRCQPPPAAGAGPRCLGRLPAEARPSFGVASPRGRLPRSGRAPWPTARDRTRRRPGDAPWEAARLPDAGAGRMVRARPRAGCPEGLRSRSRPQRARARRRSARAARGLAPRAPGGDLRVSISLPSWAARAARAGRRSRARGLRVPASARWRGHRRRRRWQPLLARGLAAAARTGPPRSLPPAAGRGTILGTLGPRSWPSATGDGRRNRQSAALHRARRGLRTGEHGRSGGDAIEVARSGHGGGWPLARPVRADRGASMPPAPGGSASPRPGAPGVSEVGRPSAFAPAGAFGGARLVDEPAREGKATREQSALGAGDRDTRRGPRGWASAAHRRGRGW